MEQSSEANSFDESFKQFGAKLSKGEIVSESVHKKMNEPVIIDSTPIKATSSVTASTEEEVASENSMKDKQVLIDSRNDEREVQS